MAKRTGQGLRGNVIRGVSLAAVGAATGLVLVVPHAVGMAWSDVFHVFSRLSFGTVAALAGLWLLGLWTHTYVLTAALPGLSQRRALLLNLSGSAVSNLVPFGGAAGIGVGFAMARSWRIAPGNFAAFTAISNLWNVLGKLLVGATLVGVAIVAGLHFPASMRNLVVLGSGSVALLAVMVIAAVSSPRLGRYAGRLIDVTANGVLARLRARRRVRAEHALDGLRAVCMKAIAAGWGRLTVGVIAYLGLQAALLAACMMAVGAHLPLLAMTAAFGVERILSVFPFTPGGAGVAELGSVAVLVALGGDPALMAAGVLLYRTFTFLLEIPVGGVSTAVWLLYRARLAPSVELAESVA